MASFHVTVNSVGRRTIAPDGDQRRAMRQRVLLTYGDRIGLYAFVDDHGHLVVDVPVEAARRFAGRVVRTLSACTGLRFESHVKPVDGRRHLSSLVSYLATQPEHHGLGIPPALWPDGCSGDLLGLRLTPGFRPELIRSWLPRWRPDHLAQQLALPRVSPASAADVHGAGLRMLVRACREALDAESRPRAATTRRARKVAVDLGTHAGFRQVDIARALDMSPSRVCELTQQPADEVAGEVARRRLAVMVARREFSDPGWAE